MRTTSRRSLLAGISAAPAAMLVGALPSVALPRQAPADAALIEQARKVHALAKRFDQVSERRATLEDRLQTTTPWKPSCHREIEALREAEMKATGVERTLENFFHPKILAADERIDAAAKVIRARNAIEVAAWQADQDRVSRRIGLRAAERLASRLDDKFHAEILCLTDMHPMSAAGLSLKAHAAMEAAKHGIGGTEWIDGLVLSVVRDAARLGGPRP